MKRSKRKSDNTSLLSVKRFGPRYGKTAKDKFANIEAQQKKLYTCPDCSRNAVKRVSRGIWQCKKCGNKFTSKAYSVGKTVKLQTEIAEL